MAIPVFQASEVRISRTNFPKHRLHLDALLVGRKFFKIGTHPRHPSVRRMPMPRVKRINFKRSNMAQILSAHLPARQISPARSVAKNGTKRSMRLGSTNVRPSWNPTFASVSTSWPARHHFTLTMAVQRSRQLVARATSVAMPAHSRRASFTGLASRTLPTRP